MKMEMLEEKPESEFCYDLILFGQGMRCPDLDEAITMAPKCKKYGKELSWNISGRVLKCEECLAEK